MPADTYPMIETELDELFAARETLRDRAREIMWRGELGEQEPGDAEETARLAEEISALSGRVCFLRCMR